MIIYFFAYIYIEAGGLTLFNNTYFSCVFVLVSIQAGSRHYALDDALEEKTKKQ